MKTSSSASARSTKRSISQDSTAPSHRDTQPDARPPAAHLVREQHVPHLALAEPNTGIERELDGEQLERPRRPPPTAVLRRAVDVADEPLLDLGRDLDAAAA
jgi:hypothetical protein